MKKTVIFFSFFALMMIPLVAHSNVLTFEELNGNGSFSNPYQGIINWESGSWSYSDVSQGPYFPHSGKTRTFESISDYTPSWNFVQPVIYNGSWFSGYSIISIPNNPNLTVTIQMDLYLNNVLVFQTGTFTPSSTPTFFATNYNDLVDRVVVNTNAPDWWAMDDLTYNCSVPEPMTLLLLGLGFVGLARMKRRFRD